ncbi:LysR substrate-binding domain-containing protein [Propionivibrio dicarboxylicus]|uniref:LysR family transcriptional regulator, glycine cleavage system transcriptional activator n=1 Tax=Propionivibrio dicarboxylicus TaxID=83767 RepID=A0A1G8ABE4_9RHOO|nr:LysR substrate-binding domain-containing protein [Propionivibrio dicarboxylicus]SDH18211.1 LysR family transcriptional regulator, glycine cleavage system transcriptional activator [Propionivibrio dicarboxylicus]
MAYRLPPLSTLRTFEAAARHLSFKKAADELAVTPSAVSQQIKKLEAWLGADLFLRLPEGIALSEQGAAMLPGIRAGLDNFAAGVEQTRRPRAFDLTLSAPPSFATRWLVHHVAGFAARCPDVAIRIASNPDNIDGPRTLADLAKRQATPGLTSGEVAIRFGEGHYPGYAIERLLQPEYVPVCSPAVLQSGPPLRTPADIAQRVLIHDEMIPAIDKRPSWRAWLHRAGVVGVDAERGPRFSNSVLVHEAVLEGQGIALVIRQHVESDVAAGRLVIPFPISLPSLYSYFVVIARGDIDKPVVGRFRDWLRAELTSPRTGA